MDRRAFLLSAGLPLLASCKGQQPSVRDLVEDAYQVLGGHEITERTLTHVGEDADQLHVRIVSSFYAQLDARLRWAGEKMDYERTELLLTYHEGDRGGKFLDAGLTGVANGCVYRQGNCIDAVKRNELQWEYLNAIKALNRFYSDIKRGR